MAASASAENAAEFSLSSDLAGFFPLRVSPSVKLSGYEMKSIWTRNDLSDTSIMKLSTATGYIYGYVQDVTTGMWQYIILDFETGETVFTKDVSNKYGYNNMAISMYAGNSGNALYCPTENVVEAASGE